MSTQNNTNHAPSGIVRTLTELLALEAAALDLAIDHGIVVPADQCALRRLLCSQGLRASLLKGAAAATGITVPLDQQPELADLIALEIEYGNASFAGGGSAVMSSIVDE